jgi:hypothetical protein
VIGRLDYEARKAARIERLRARAERVKVASKASFERAGALADAIPLGQPVLVGHHSEKRARRDQDRIHAGMANGVALAKEASTLSRRADAAEENQAISSDDPNAIERLREKLAGLGAQRDRYKAASKALRTKDPQTALIAVGFSEEGAVRLLKSLDGETKIPSYLLSNLGADIRRVRQRIQQLEEQATALPHEPVSVGAATVSEEDNRVRISFPGRQPDAVCSLLRQRGFIWARSAQAWQRMARPGVWEIALSLVEQISANTAE